MTCPNTIVEILEEGTLPYAYQFIIEITNPNNKQLEGRWIQWKGEDIHCWYDPEKAKAKLQEVIEKHMAVNIEAVGRVVRVLGLHPGWARTEVDLDDPV
jgi:hypothetical protein